MRVASIIKNTALAGAASAALVTPAAAQLEEIIVQAQKRAQNIQDLAISVSAFDGDDIFNLGNDIGALAGQVPNVESYGNGTFIQAFFIRGIGLNEFAGNFNSPVAIHSDEVYISKNWQAARPVFDIGRIEVLKGPQGTVFGRNTTGGAVNYYTAEPTEELEGFVRGEFDSHERFNVQGAVSGELAENLTGRFSFFTSGGSGGPQFNLFTNDEWGATKLHEFRGQLAWDNGDTRVRLLAHGGVDNTETMLYKGPGVFSGTGPGFCPEALAGQVSFAPETCTKFNGLAALAGNPELETEPADLFTVNNDYPGRKNDTFYGGFLRVEHDIGAITLTSITAFEHYTRDHREDSDSTPIVSTNTDYFNQIDQFTQELRAGGTVMDDRLSFIVGGFFQSDSLEQIDGADLSGSPFAPVSNPPLPPRLQSNFDQDLRSYALFANADYQLTDQLTATFGARYTREVTEVDGTTSAALNDVVGIRDLPMTTLATIDAIGEQTSAANPTISGITSNRYVDNAFNWKVGLAYEPNDATLLYANAQTGFRTGGFSVPFGGVAIEYEDERVLAVEAGVKSRFLEDKIQVNAAVFRTRTKDAQVNVDDPLSPLVPITRNIPEIVTWGAEAELVAAPNEYLTATFGIAWLDSEVTDAGGRSVTTFSAPLAEDGSLIPTPLQGNTPVNAPEWQLNGRLDFAYPIEAKGLAVLASADARWTDDRFLEITNQPADGAPSYFVANARVGLGDIDGRWNVIAYVRNLTNEAYLTYINNIPGVGFKLDIFGERRTWGLAATYNF
ncbi:MAG: TonB-dependent receptor [Pseudomonadota bacterium]